MTPSGGQHDEPDIAIPSLNLIRSRLGARLFLIVASLVLVTGVVATSISATSARRSVLEEAQHRVLSVVRERHARLDDWLALFFSSAQRELLVVPVAEDSARQQWHRRISALPGLLEAAIFDGSGSLIFPPQDRMALPGYFPNSTAIQAADLFHQPAYGPVHLDAGERPVFDVVIPIAWMVDDSALLALRLDSRIVLDPVLMDTSSLGDSGEIFLLDREMRMLTPSRYHTHPAPLKHTMPIPPAKAALEHGVGSLQYTNFLGRMVVGGYSYMPRQRWILVGELDVNEALRPVNSIYLRSFIVIGLALLTLLVLTLALARSWVRPLVALTSASERVSAGDYSVRAAPSMRRDELAILTDSFNRMVAALEQGRANLADAQRQMVQQEKMAVVGRLVASIVHEMRNPLSSIKMNLRLLKRGCEPGSAAEEHIGLAAAEASRLESMLQELLDYGKPVEVKLDQFDPAGFAAAAIEEARSYAAERGATLQFDSETKTIPVRADRELLRRTLDNLLRNAVEACGVGESVTLCLDHDGRHVRIVLTDTGRGMSESVRERIFDPFFTTREDGTGLGLSNVRKFVEAMRGELKIESAEGVGTTVTVTLPGAI